MRNFPSLWGSERQDPIRALQREMDRWMNQMTGSGWREITLPATSAYIPACDLEETDTHYLVSMDLPGISKNDVKIELNEDQLRVHGERKEEREETQKPPYRSERYYGSFERIVSLPGNANAEKAEAQFENGVLKVAIPKAEGAKSKQIPVSEGKGGIFAKWLSKKESPPGQEKGAATVGAREKVA